MAFESLIGNSQIKDTLNKIVKNENSVHGYIFSGIDGIGKRLFAIEFAKMLMCDSSKKPCNKCKSCLSFDGNNNPDFKIIESDGNSIKIEQVRLMNSKIIEKPINSFKKVYIINDAQNMTVDAQNSLLKTLEEPPEYAIIILICNNESQLLNTIKSRCTKISFQPISNNELKEYIFNKTGEEIENSIISLSEGSIGKYLSLKENKNTYEELELFLNSLEDITKSSIFINSEILYKNTEDIQEILNYMNLKFFEKSKSNDKYLNCIDIVEQTKKRLKSNNNYNMTIDYLLLQIWEELNEKHCRG